MNRIQTTAVLAALLASACASVGGPGSNIRTFQAGHTNPKPGEITEDAERAVVQDARNHATRSDNARASGNLEQARAEDRAAAEGFAKFCEQFPSSEWRIVLRRMAAERYLQGEDYEAGAAQAQKLITDPEATDETKAVGARLAAAGWQMVANAESRAGKIERLRLLTAAQRGGQPPKPRPPAAPWKSFVDAADTYTRYMNADPLLKASEAEQRARGGTHPAQLGLLAGEVEYAYDNMEEARKRFDQVIQLFPGDAEIMEAAVPLYLETYLVLGDEAGYEAAVKRVEPVVKAQADRTAAEAKAAGATDEQKKAAEAFAKLEDNLSKQQQGAGFAQASRLLQANKFPEAAEGFEAFATANKDHPDAPNALYNAAVAWDKAKEPAKARADRERLVRDYPNSKVAGQGMLALAAAQSRGGEHAAAEKAYLQYLERFPDGPQRCIALQNVGYELDQLKRKEEAARRYEAFARDAACAKDDPNTAAKALYRAGVLFSEAKKKKEAKDAWTALVGMQGVTDPVVKSWVEDARSRLKAK